MSKPKQSQRGGVRRRGAGKVVSRRRFLGVAGLAAGTMLARRAVAWQAAQTENGALKPRTQTVTGTDFGAETRRGIVSGPDGVTSHAPIGTAETAATATAVPFTHLLARWRATLREQTRVELEVRASADGQTWTAWGRLARNDDLVDPNDPPGVFWSNTIFTGVASFWQLRATLTQAPDGAAPVLHEVRIDTVDARSGRSGDAQPAAAAPLGAANQPSFVSRAGWGGSDVLTNSVAPTWYIATHEIVHHTADPNTLRVTETSWADRVRAQWAFHTYSRGWGDIGYNWLIAPDGVIYEGRNGSSDVHRDAVGFHDTGNQGSMGVALIGTFGAGVPNVPPIVPTAAAQDALVRLLTWKAAQRNIDPFGRSFYYGCSRSQLCAPYNSGSVVPNIAGHRQITPGHTSCPGDLGMGVMDGIRSRVRDALASGPPTTPVPTVAPGPEVALTASVDASGVIWLAWSSSPGATLFELQAYDTAEGRWTVIGSSATSPLPFFGVPGHSYSFTIRGWDGRTWGAVTPAPVLQTVPANARFGRAWLPMIGR